MIYQKKLPLGYYSVAAEKPANAITVKQIHTDQVINFQQAKNEVTQGDGIFWLWSELTDNVAPTIFTADCLPIVILGERGGAILHAGWRGVKAKIYLNPAVKNLKPYYFYIGPSIQQQSFEVTSEFLDYFPEKQFFKTKENKYTFNLQGQTIFDLKDNYPGIEGDDAQIDTFVDERFQSFRRNKMKRNNYNIFTLNKDLT